MEAADPARGTSTGADLVQVPPHPMRQQRARAPAEAGLGERHPTADNGRRGGSSTPSPSAQIPLPLHTHPHPHPQACGSANGFESTLANLRSMDPPPTVLGSADALASLVILLFDLFL